MKCIPVMNSGKGVTVMSLKNKGLITVLYMEICVYRGI